MADASAGPLVTFYVCAYNQAAFVREAVKAALAQTYSPLEVLLSDDCSTDGTFEIMQEVVKAYSGPHKVILNRNPLNLGLSSHVNLIMGLATGELVIAADGDDVSMPHRTERCVEVWLGSGKPAALASSVACIDAAGKPTRRGDQWFRQFLPLENESRPARLLRFSKQGSPRLISCSAAWTRKLFDEFGPMPHGLWFEDDVFTLRALLCDRIVYIHEALVNYREHESNLSNRVQFAPATPWARERAEHTTRTQARRRRESLLSYLPDLDRALSRGWIDRPLYEEVRRTVERACTFYEVIEDWWNVGWMNRVGLFVFLVRSGRLGEVRWATPRMLPFPLFVGLGAIWSRTRRRPPWSVQDDGGSES